MLFKSENCFYAAVILVSAVFVLPGCGDEEGADDVGQNVLANEIEVVSIQLDDADDIIRINDSLQLAVNAIKSDGSKVAVNNEVYWSVDDASLATITDAGLLSGKSQSGSFNVMAEFAGMTSLASFFVSDADLLGISIDGSNSVNECGDLSFTATGQYSDRDGIVEERWIVTDVDGNSTELAKFNDPETGILSTFDNGIVKVTAAAYNNAEDLVSSPSIEVTVNDNLETITLTSSVGSDSNEINLSEGATTEFSVTGHYNDASTANITGNTTFSSSDTEIALFKTSDNILTAINGEYDGSSVVTISAVCGNVNSTAGVTVIGPVIEKIRVKNSESGSAIVEPGESIDLSIVATFEDDSGSNENYSYNIAWSINQEGLDEDIIENIEIDSNGTVTVDDSLNGTADVVVTVEARAVDVKGNTVTNSDDVELTDDFAVTIRLAQP